MIYLDHAATAPMPRTVIEAMWPFMTEVFGNASSHHGIGRAAAAGLSEARVAIAEILGCRPSEVIFTSGGTESNNLAIKGLALAQPRGRHIVTSAIEHEAVLAACEYLVQHHGFTHTVIGVDAYGLIDVEAFDAAITDQTTLCSVMYANNEIGTVQPIAQLAERCRAKRVPLHTDAVQAVGQLPIEVPEVGVQALSMSAHKFGGPKGIGVLYVDRSLPLVELNSGGGQESARRSGTSNVAGAVGLAAALVLADSARASTIEEMRMRRDALIERVLESVPSARLTGHRTQRLASHASFVFPATGGEAVLQELELHDVCCSSGSACAADSEETSHVLTAIGMTDAEASTAVRFTLGPTTTNEDVETAAALVPQAVAAVTALA